MLVHVVAAYGVGDLAFAEFAAGFCIAQLGLHPAPPGTLIYHNVAPREDDVAARAGNAGERLAYARLPTGVRVIGVHAGYALSCNPRWASPRLRTFKIFASSARCICYKRVWPVLIRLPLRLAMQTE